ncbi:MAG: GspH/FimT family pseudopilin [Burkholderiales bacterium]
MNRRPLGFTLLDLLVSLAIGGLLLGLGVPGYRAWIADLELRDRVEALVEAMSHARAEAIKRGERVNLCPTHDGAHCAGDGHWEAGWLLFADANHDGDRDDDEPVVRREGPAHAGITVRGNRPVANYVSYTPHGQTRMANGALQMGTFTVCRSGANAVDVVLANGGRVRVNRTRAACP